MHAATLQTQPSLAQLTKLINIVPKFPVSAANLVDLAQSSNQPSEVTNFYKTFGQDVVFDTPDDLKERTEQVEIMRQEEREMPPEQMVVPEEY